jgi:hypothetical protein
MKLASLQVFLWIAVSSDQTKSSNRFIARRGLVADPSSAQVIQAAVAVDRD